MRIVNPYIIRLTGTNRQCRGLTVEVTPGSPNHFAFDRSLAMTWWVGSARLADPTKPEVVTVTAEHVPGTDCFLECE